MPLPDHIEPFKEGDTRTLLNAEEANKLIAVYNALVNVRGQNGIRVYVSEDGIVIEPDTV